MVQAVWLSGPCVRCRTYGVNSHGPTIHVWSDRMVILLRSDFHTVLLSIKHNLRFLEKWLYVVAVMVPKP